MKYVVCILFMILLNVPKGYSHGSCTYGHAGIQVSNYPKLSDGTSHLFFDLVVSLTGSMPAYDGRLIIVKLGGGSFPVRHLDTIDVDIPANGSYTASQIKYDADYLDEGFHYLGEDTMNFLITVIFPDGPDCVDELSELSAAIRTKIGTTADILSGRTTDFSIGPVPVLNHSLSIYSDAARIKSIRLLSVYGIEIFKLKTESKGSDVLINIPVDCSGTAILEITDTNGYRLYRKLIIE